MNSCRCSLHLPNHPSGYSAVKGQIRYSTGGSLFFAVLITMALPRLARAAVHASIIVDARTGAILYAQNPEALAHPASLTKLMTLFITFEQLEQGGLNLDEALHVSTHAAAQQPTKLWLRPGSDISVRAAILGITTRSANDAAVVLAEAIGGSESRFAKRMTRTAHKLGMTRTRFYNASGLPDSRQWTTAHDMARLAIALIDDFPEYYRFFSVRSFKFHGHIVYGHDHVLDEFPGADGLKTGYIRASGYNLVTSAVRGKRRLVGVVLGGRTAVARDHLMIALMNRGFSSIPGVELADRTVPDRDSAQETKGTQKLVKADIEVPAGEEADVRDCVIEIGGDFSNQRAVRRVLSSAIRTAPGLLATRSELVVKLRGPHFRARFRGLENRAAMLACHTLQLKGFHCRIVRAPLSTNDLAGVSASTASQVD